MTTVTSDDSLLKGIGRGISIAVSVLIGLVLVAAIVLPRLIGAVPLTVLTGSMEPALRPGTMIVSQQVDPNDVRVGDIVTYQAEIGQPDLITHRVTQINYGINGVDHFTTRGDANGADDAPVAPDQIRGRYAYQLPLLGYAAQAIPAAAKPHIAQGIGAVVLVWGLAQIALSIRTKRRAS